MPPLEVIRLAALKSLEVMNDRRLRIIAAALAWMTLPFAISYGFMSLPLITHASPLMQRAALTAVLALCALGDFLALARLWADKDWELNWKLVSLTVKIMAFVCMFSFATAAAVSAFYLLRSLR